MLESSKAHLAEARSLAAWRTQESRASIPVSSITNKWVRRGYAKRLVILVGQRYSTSASKILTLLRRVIIYVYNIQLLHLHITEHTDLMTTFISLNVFESMGYHVDLH